MLKTKEEIKEWLEKYQISGYNINDDLTVDVVGSVSFSSNDLEEILVQFGRVDGHFNCASNKLVSLKGCPRYV